MMSPNFGNNPIFKIEGETYDYDGNDYVCYRPYDSVIKYDSSIKVNNTAYRVCLIDFMIELPRVNRNSYSGVDYFSCIVKMTVMFDSYSGKREIFKDKKIKYSRFDLSDI